MTDLTILPQDVREAMCLCEGVRGWYVLRDYILAVTAERDAAQRLVHSYSRVCTDILAKWAKTAESEGCKSITGVPGSSEFKDSVTELLKENGNW